MTSHQIHLIKSSWAMVGNIDQLTVGQIFYNRLFEIAPEVKPMFRNGISEQSKKLLATLSYIVSKLERLNDIVDEVAKLAQRHVDYGVKTEHYKAVGEALLWTLQKGLGDYYFNEEMKQAWTDCYVTLSSAMIEASAYSKLHAA